jgi:branched-chain amino acid transport system permease protein
VRGGVQLTIYSLILIAVILWRPTGLLGLLTDAYRRVVDARRSRRRASRDG